MITDVTCWEKAAAVGQVAEAVLVALALLVAWRQLRKAHYDQRLGIVWQMFRELGDKKAREARRFVFQERSVYHDLEDGSVDLDYLDPMAVKAAQNVSNVLDRLGYAVKTRLAPEKVVLDGYHCLVVRSWIALKPFVEAVRRERGEPTYQENFEDLATRALKRKEYQTCKKVKFGRV